MSAIRSCVYCGRRKIRRNDRRLYPICRTCHKLGFRRN